jgi:hypothetical protein
MITQKFIVFGDSWPWGADLKPGEKTFGELIAERKNIEFQNYSEISTAVEHMILQLQRMIRESNFDNTSYTALFSVTALSRFMYFSENPNFDFKYKTNCGYVMFNGVEKDDAASDAYYKYIHSIKLEKFKFYMSIMTLQNLCKQFNINDYYALSFSTVEWDSTLEGIDRNKFWDNGCTNFLDMFGCQFVDPENKYFAGTASAHPNQLGHELIANNLYEWIK